MNITAKIIKFELRDVFRSRWVIIYGFLLLVITELLFRFSGDSSKTVISTLNIILLLNPLVSLIFGTAYMYNSREFIELLLSQPIKRRELFWGLYLGLTIPLVLVFLIGTGLPLTIHNPENFAMLFTMLASGGLLTMMFTGTAICIASYFEDKAMGLGAAILLWFFFAFIYDGLILIFTITFQDFPLETPLIAISFINPIDLARILVMLKLDTAALMGYTGAVFQKFFGQTTGIILSFSMLIIWIIIPTALGYNIFRKKNF
ncbi:MAG: ABC transporter permease subunit [FCB group bacterium]|jgi:Cu-processing system permease protein